ncbi:cation:proton antiporter family protein [Nesterenkonia sp. F]|uniref:cation:proton antiporter family protein n=1 Tax=Nesterenkonia sp. F TaxID=795955 RepID=UPI000255D24B|nr:cation:proton antiporter family protein [Nesterenkonia sp. F]
MLDVAVTLLVATAAGVLARWCRVPPLVGFLGAGFLLGGAGMEPFDGLAELADVGVTLLLFTIGLKFDVRALMRREAWGSAVTHMVLFTLVTAGLLGLLAGIGMTLLDGGWATLALLGFALSFSSTVLCVKVLEERSDDGAYYGQAAIAILVLQDLAAVGFITATAEEPPSLWAIALILLLPGAWLLGRILEKVGHGELLVLFGAAMALGPGYWLFDSLGIKGDLGALVIGLLLARHPRAEELSKALFSVKELFLIGFFLTIGMQAVPTLADLALAVLLCVVLLPVKTAGFVLLARQLGLRNRTAALSGLVLGNFSEFALIVGAVGVSGGLIDEDQLTVVAVAVALSMVLSSLVNGRRHQIVRAIARRLPAQDPARINAADRPLDIGDAEVVVLGMGRIGRGAYDEVREERELGVVGVENDHAALARLIEQGYRVVEGDATDYEFWDRLRHSSQVRLVILAMPHHDSNTFALDQLRGTGYPGEVAAVVRHPDQDAELRARGVDAVFNLYEGAGIALAETACRGLDPESSDGRPGDAPEDPRDGPGAGR